MDPEYARLQQELHANIDIRNKLLTFSFTTVLTVIGIGLANLDSIFFLAYLLPFFIIIPCTSRIIYYKDLYAQQAAYLTVYYEKFMTFEIQNNTLLFCKDHWLIGLFINHEMEMLALCCVSIYYASYYQHITAHAQGSAAPLWIFAALPLLLLWVVYRIISTVPTYSQAYEQYIIKFRNDKLQSAHMNHS